MARHPLDISVEIQIIHRQIGRLIDRILGTGWDRLSQGETFAPPVDVYERADAIIVEAELPGVDVSSLEVFAQGGTLFIEGWKEADYPPAGTALFHVFERSFGRFEVKIRLPGPVQFQQAKASYVDGIVKLRLPKIQERRRKKAVVQVEIV